MSNEVNFWIVTKDRSTPQITTVSRAMKELGDTSVQAAKKIDKTSSFTGRLSKRFSILDKRVKEMKKSSHVFSIVQGSMKKTGLTAKKTSEFFSTLSNAGKKSASILVKAFGAAGRFISRAIRAGLNAAKVAVSAFAAQGMQYQGQMDTYKTMTTTYLSSASASKQLIKEAQQFAIKTPLDTAGVMRSVTTLIQYGRSGKSAIEVTKDLADVSAGSKEKMDRLGIAFGQIAAKGRLQAEEVRQLTNSGYNPLKTISEQTGESMAQLMKRMKYGVISFEEVEKALKKDTDAGGKFYKNVMSLSKTLPGATSNIKEMGTTISGYMTKGLYQSLTQVMVAVQDVMNAFTDALLEGRGFGVALEEASKKANKLGGAAKFLMDSLIKLKNSPAGKFASDIASGYSKAVEAQRSFNDKLKKVKPVTIKQLNKEVAAYNKAMGGAPKSEKERAKVRLQILNDLREKSRTPITVEMRFKAIKSAVINTDQYAKAKKVFDDIRPILQNLAELAKNLGDIFMNIIVPAFSGAYLSVSGIVSPIGLVNGSLEWINNNAKGVSKLLVVVAKGYLAIKGAALAARGAALVFAGAQIAATIALSIWGFLCTPITTITEAFTLAWWGLNYAMKANLISIIILGVAALITGLIVAYKKSETFRNAIHFVWDKIKALFGWIKSNWKLLPLILGGPIGIGVAIVIKNFDKIKSGFGKVVDSLKSAWNSFAKILQRGLDLINKITGKDWKISTFSEERKGSSKPKPRDKAIGDSIDALTPTKPTPKKSVVIQEHAKIKSGTITSAAQNSGGINMFTASSRSGGQQDVVLNANLYLDGKQVGKSVTRHAISKMARA